MTSLLLQFFGGFVYSYVGDDYYGLCASDAEGAEDYDHSVTVPVRPIVLLPSNLQVEETSSGTYDLV